MLYGIGEILNGGWIPTYVGLPVKNVEVIVTTGHGEVTIGAKIDNNHWFINEGQTITSRDDILAWMPLPTPYKGVSNSAPMIDCLPQNAYAVGYIPNSKTESEE